MPDNVEHFGTPFLTDIAHNADPSPRTRPDRRLSDAPDPDSTTLADFSQQPPGTYDDELLDRPLRLR